MSTGRVISDKDLGKIEIMHKQGQSLREIAKEIGHSASGIKYVVDNIGVERKPHRGRKRKLSERDERDICRQASNKVTSCPKIKAEGRYQVSTRTINRTIGRSDHLVFQKMLTKPRISGPNKTKRLEFSHDHQTWREEWENVLWSDEKKFNLDGPDGLAHYWHDLRKEKLIFSKRQQGGGSVMIWSGFGWLGKAPIHVCKGSMTSKTYIQLLKTSMMPNIEHCSGHNALFMQDNASIHRSDETMQFFEEKGITLLVSPANSPDLNPMENVWGLLARRVYANSRTFPNVASLQKAIEDCWAKFTIEELKPFISSMPDRMYQVIFNHGGNTKY